MGPGGGNGNAVAMDPPRAAPQAAAAPDQRQPRPYHMFVRMQYVRGSTQKLADNSNAAGEATAAWLKTHGMGYVRFPAPRVQWDKTGKVCAYVVEFPEEVAGDLINQSRNAGAAGLEGWSASRQLGPTRSRVRGSLGASMPRSCRPPVRLPRSAIMATTTPSVSTAPRTRSLCHHPPLSRHPLATHHHTLANLRPTG